ncbi:hypothetical protein PBRA_001904 [Plasmodiophora brassicae]|uniref:HAT C-terminal dimerisation domain-containing protein n=1 Tax=Plasmodiophora brassicae TaxID=37360 RepID=A0A0G4J101_PLABS|nr:hypothetical protein PBRA_001904 [Plasmodiophora brassicae]
MIDRWFTFEKVAVHLISAARFSSRLEAFADLTKPLTWRVLKSCKDFLEDAYNFTKAASGSAYATISMQPLIFKHMRHLCERTAAGRSPCGFTTPAVKRAATAMLTKLTKYEPYMCSKLNLLALLLDPRTSNACDDAKNMKEHLSGTLAANYGYQSAAPPRQDDDMDVAFDLFAEAEGDQAAKDDEVDDFYIMTARADRSCKDILQWWKAHEERFPTISRLARDVFVIQGSSVNAYFPSRATLSAQTGARSTHLPWRCT